MNHKFTDLIVPPSNYDDDRLFEYLIGYYTWPKEKRRSVFNQDIAKQERWIEGLLEMMGCGLGALDALAAIDGTTESALKVGTWRRYQGVLKAQGAAAVAHAELKAGLIEKIVLFTRFKPAAMILLEDLRSYGAVVIHGDTPVEKRARVVAQFKNNPKVRALICNAAGATAAVDLVVTNQAIVVEADWRRDLTAQACMRLIKGGQTRDVLVRFACLANGPDARITSTLKNYARKDVLGFAPPDPFS